MPDVPKKRDKSSKGTQLRPFQRAVLRGLGVVLPPLLTILLFLWAGSLILDYVLKPVDSFACWGIARATCWWEIRTEQPAADEIDAYHGLSTGRWIPKDVYVTVQKNPGDENLRTAYDYYHRYVRVTWLKPATAIPLFLSLFLIILYVLGKVFAAGIGRLAWASCESLIQRLPVIRNVYSAVKQVTDFVFTEREIEFNRVVAVEYPRKGVWSIGFVTGESMLDMRSAANEPILSVLMPTSPMPATGFTITVRKSDTIDLDITVDQAIQFVVSCGVVVPVHQQHEEDSDAQVTAAATSRAASAQRALDMPSSMASSDDSGQEAEAEAKERAMRERA